MFTSLKELSERFPDSRTPGNIGFVKSVKPSNLILPIRKYLFPILPKWDATPEEIEIASVYNPNPVFVKSVEEKYVVMASKEKPKKIIIRGSDDKRYAFLLKHDKSGDLSKEARFIEFIEMVNNILKSDKECAKRDLQLKTYSIVNLTSSSVLIEWIENTETLKNAINAKWKELGMPADLSDFCLLAKKAKKDSSFWEKLQETSKPVLYKWFLDLFPDSESWYNARLKFTRSHATWCVIGYLIGLGDRHGDNILLNTQNGEVANVDFDCLFDKGKKLGTPELVPFRLTRNIIDALGIFREKTEFAITCNIVLKAMCRNKNNIISNLYNFIHDPLIEVSGAFSLDPKAAIEKIEKKLEESSKDTNAMIQKLIYEATSDEFLKKMFYGWLPWM